MTVQSVQQFANARAVPLVDVSIVMPCLNEAECLATCIENAREASRMIEAAHGLTCEIVVADNGSTDGSQAIALEAGARVEHIGVRGYGAALIGGGLAARGRYIVFGDADGSYDFREACPMIGKLMDGADLCMGSRFQGGIAPGAMPWKNRYIGNPVLTGILNLMFKTRVDDAHCGLRAITRDAFRRLRLSGTGMEFASEMVIKAALQKCTITEVPVTLSPDLRNREPHLRPWRDGWRHLRYLFMLSPTWVFLVPAIVALLFGAVIFGLALLDMLAPGRPTTFGASWTILAGASLGIGHIASLLAITTHLHGVREGFRIASATVRKFERLVTLETMVVGGIALAAVGAIILGLVAADWTSSGYEQPASVVPLVSGTTLLTLGMQTVLGAFLLAIICGNEAHFLGRGLSTSIPNPPLDGKDFREIEQALSQRQQ